MWSVKTPAAIFSIIGAESSPPSHKIQAHKPLTATQRQFNMTTQNMCELVLGARPAFQWKATKQQRLNNAPVNDDYMQRYLSCCGCGVLNA